MAITDFAAFLAELQSPKEIQPITIATATTVAGRWYDLWVPTQPAGVAPSTAAAPTSTTVGTLGQQDGSTLGLIGARLNAMNPGVYLLIDRLSHQGGLSGIVTTSQTTNLATSALTRYTSGVGVMMCLSIYSQIGATGSTVNLTYTDTADASQTSPTLVIGGTGFREANRALMVPLVSGGNGVKSVQSVIINTTSTGTAGNFGVTLFKPLAVVIVDDVGGVSVADLVTGKFGGGLPTIQNSAALCFMGMSAGLNLMAGGTFLFSEW